MPRRQAFVDVDVEALAFRRGVVRAGGQVRLAESLQESVREALARAELLTLFDPPEVEEGRQAARPS